MCATRSWQARRRKHDFWLRVVADGLGDVISDMFISGGNPIPTFRENIGRSAANFIGGDALAGDRLWQLRFLDGRPFSGRASRTPCVGRAMSTSSSPSQ